MLVSNIDVHHNTFVLRMGRAYWRFWGRAEVFLCLCWKQLFKVLLVLCLRKNHLPVWDARVSRRYLFTHCKWVRAVIILNIDLLDGFHFQWLGTFPITCVGKTGPGPLCNSCVKSKKPQGTMTYTTGIRIRYENFNSHLCSIVVDFSSVMIWRSLILRRQVTHLWTWLYSSMSDWWMYGHDKEGYLLMLFRKYVEIGGALYYIIKILSWLTILLFVLLSYRMNKYLRNFDNILTIHYN